MTGRRLDVYSKALRNLEGSTSYEPPYDPVTEAGLVALFEICLELAWKATKAALLEQGYPEAQTGSPRMVVKCAYAAGLIQDEDGWLEALAARNLLTHSYNDEVALRIIDETRRTFLPLFQELESALRGGDPENRPDTKAHDVRREDEPGGHRAQIVDNT